MDLILSCEHASHRVPARYAPLFDTAAEVLRTHRGWDPGALRMAKTLQHQLGAPLFATRATRLLVEPNRSQGHPQLFSDWTRGLSPAERSALLNRYYHPHRDRVAQWIEHGIGEGRRVLHVSVHTFTPRWDGQLRRADVGILYDPRRRHERTFVQRWRDALADQRPDLTLRRNYPYAGKADGLTTSLRRRFCDDSYLGLELEVNQARIRPASAWQQLARDIGESLRDALGTPPRS